MHFGYKALKKITPVVEAGQDIDPGEFLEFLLLGLDLAYQGRLFQCIDDHFAQGDGAYGIFYQIIGETGLHCLHRHRLIASAGKHDHGLLESGLAKHAENLKAGHSAKMIIDKYDISLTNIPAGSKGLSTHRCRRAVNICLKAVNSLDVSPQDLDIARIVIDNEKGKLFPWHRLVPMFWQDNDLEPVILKGMNELDKLQKVNRFGYEGFDAQVV
jgi:hypothetical protein